MLIQDRPLCYSKGQSHMLCLISNAGDHDDDYIETGCLFFKKIFRKGTYRACGMVFMAHDFRDVNNILG